MGSGFTFAALRAGNPVETVREVLSRIAARGDDAVWISRVPSEALLADATALAQRPPEGLPLYGLPFAVKDNIDAAGLPTSAACPEFTYTPAVSAPVVERLRAAGALLVGKTNLDQFATGLVGTRSPYGVPKNPFNPAYIAGGSSSGSAVAVAARLVAFALGTDTAGSGRVPAAFNNIVGLKPSRRVIPTAGVVPACPPFDCVSILAPSVADAAAVLDVASTSPLPPAIMPTNFTFGVPRPDQREFFGDDAAAALFERAIARLPALGGRPRTIDLAPFLAAGALLYEGPFVAMRRAAIDAATAGRRDILHPVTRRIIESGDTIGDADLARGRERLADLARATAPVWREIDLLLLPTAGTIYRIAEVEADPVGLNTNLGRYTNFTNSLDLAAIAVPAGFRPSGLPFGVQLLAPVLHDKLLAAIAAAFVASEV